jgi:hypothetical protein
MSKKYDAVLEKQGEIISDMNAKRKKELMESQELCDRASRNVE